MNRIQSVMRLKRLWLKQSTMTLLAPGFQVWLLVCLGFNSKQVWIWGTGLFAGIGFLIYWVLLQYVRTFTFWVLDDGSFLLRWKIHTSRIVKFRRVFCMDAKYGVLWLETDARLGTIKHGKVRRYRESQTIAIPIIYKMNTWNLIITSYQREKDKLRYQSLMREKERRCI